jgi:AcrR family transcriptional regulator
MPRVVDVDQRRHDLTAAAARVIARDGLEAATMREVAAEAGWTTGALTHYFADKRELLLATFQASLAQRRAHRPAHASAADQLRASLEGVLPLDADRRRHWLVTLACCTQASGDAALAAAQRDAYRGYRTYVTGLVDQLIVDDRIDDTGQHIAEQLIAAADGIAMQALFDPGSWSPRRQLAALDRALDAALGGVLAFATGRTR